MRTPSSMPSWRPSRLHSPRDPPRAANLRGVLVAEQADDKPTPISPGRLEEFHRVEEVTDHAEGRRRPTKRTRE